MCEVLLKDKKYIAEIINVAYAQRQGYSSEIVGVHHIGWSSMSYEEQILEGFVGGCAGVRGPGETLSMDVDTEASEPGNDPLASGN